MAIPAFVLAIGCLQSGMRVEASASRVKAGEEIAFTVTSPAGGAAAYRIARDTRVAPIKHGKLVLVPNTPVAITVTLDDPGFLLFEVEQGGKKALNGVAVDPEKIKSVAREPKDFDRFWQGELKALRSAPLKPVATLRKDKKTAGMGDAQVFKVVLDTVEGKKAYGWVVVPKGKGPFPAILEFPPYGSTAIGPPGGVWGAICAIVSVHDSDLEAPAENAYAPGHEENHRKNYFKYGLLGGLRMIDYLHTLPQFDRKRLIVTGKSQGGGFSIMAAGLDPRVSDLCAVVPAFGQHAGTRQGRSSGFPWWVWQRDKDGRKEAADRMLAEAEYYDITHFAARFKGRAVVMAAYIDTVCPPSTVVAAFNALPGRKKLVHGVGQDHNWNLPGKNWWPLWNGTLKEWVAGTR